MSKPRFEDFFELFGLPRAFRIDDGVLAARYRELAAQVHPDRFAHLGEADRRAAVSYASDVNEAYRTLGSTLARAQYLLHLAGQDAALESNTAMDTSFLMEQMEWREAVSEARAAQDVDELDHLRLRLHDRMDLGLDQLGDEIDDQRDYAAAADSVRRLMFLDKLGREIDAALEQLDT
ncbi:MAG: Fe-S protein assembly co-chaperone HscB [Rhodocyclaceae bacterium]|nr:Fe-S protein assembly co-chaperone HscB [Rhodocyclaceae bacterium]MBX3668169.1 Fe-S protein assembly co-chaperone HscB [Rhodocyclaceae bacterium]